MQAGKLRYLVTVQQPTDTPNSFGEPVITWAALVRTHASIEPLSGRELWNAQQVQAQVTHRVRLRYYPGVMAKMRVSYGSRYLNIESVIDPEERHRELELLCTEAT